VPIYALTPEMPRPQPDDALPRGLSAADEQQPPDRDVLLWEAEQMLLEQGVVDYGDLIVLTIGEPIGSPAAPTR
jgi:pyruvate kinase